MTLTATTTPNEEERADISAIDDLKDLLYTSTHNIISLNDLVTKLTEKIVLLTLSAEDTRTEIKTTQSEIKDLKEQDSRLLQQITAVKENMREIFMIDGGWSDFGDWSECSAECGGGTKKRDRTCTNPAPEHGGAECQGEDSENQDCNTQDCPVDGGWSDFGDWSECSAECGGGTKKRDRTCTNPAPEHEGAECQGEDSENQDCNTQDCPIDGGWSDFGYWSECSAECGGGTKKRDRTCTNPAPEHEGAECQGEDSENQDCNTQDCPIDGGWSDFGYWSECSAECGGGTKKRDRTCTNPAPEHEGAECQGEDSENQDCNTQDCPIDGVWSDFGYWSECSADCGGGTKKRDRTCTNPAPEHGGAECQGEDSENQDCNTKDCPIDGGWSDFGDWSGCFGDFGEGKQARVRSCTNPTPQHGGAECKGKTKESQRCAVCTYGAYGELCE
ncbi:coadhesin-like [Bolinopsis microptera]|uniref:coadhesin-like n=1 Tax=Bolinopsis microptera TaxID=2820187 RepID=UPI00307AFFE7